MMLFGVGETSLHRFLSALVQPPPNLAQSIAVQSLPVILPDMPCHLLLLISTSRAFHPALAASAHRRVADVNPVPFAVGGLILQNLSLRAAIDILLLVIHISPLRQISGMAWGTAVTQHTIDQPPFHQSVTQRRIVITGIQSYRFDLEAEGFYLTVQSGQVGVLSLTFPGVTWLSVMMAYLASTVRWSR